MEFYLKVQTAIQKAIVYDAVTDGALENHTLLIENGKIVYAGPHEQAPEYEAVEVIDGEGLFVLPGFIDLHVHGLVNEASLYSFLQNGVTSIRDLASDVFDALAWRAREKTGLIASPRIFFAGPILTCHQGYPENVWGPKAAAPIQGRYQAQEKVWQLAGLGVDVIKLGLEHELGPCLSETEVEGIVSAAHERGKRVTAHITNERDFELCVKYGVDEVAHMPSRPVSDDLWKEAVLKKIQIVPTIQAHAGWAKEWQRKEKHPFGNFCHHGFKEGHVQCKNNLERFLSFGGQVIYGTDAGNPNMPFGVSFKEWMDLQSAGMTPLQCLRMATRDAAVALGMGDQLGTIEKGKWADLVIYQHDPIKNPYNFKTIKAVFKNGQAYPAGPLEYPPPFDLDYWIGQWEKTEFKKGWLNG
jgi:imidazolonepropionase-like amidohydrolase